MFSVDNGLIKVLATDFDGLHPGLGGVEAASCQACKKRQRKCLVAWSMAMPIRRVVCDLLRRGSALAERRSEFMA